jgi:hypothetical protein
VYCMINHRICNMRAVCSGDSGELECLGCPSSVFSIDDYREGGWDVTQEPDLINERIP